MYEATVCGKVLGKKSSPIKTWVTNAGYEQFHQYVEGKRVGTFVHRFVYEFHKGGVPDGLVVDHIDGNKLNNTLVNLQAISTSDNTLKGANGKISLAERGEIHKTYKDGLLQREIADLFGISQARVSGILKTFYAEGI